MKIVVLDGYTENPGDLSWAPLEALGEVTVYDRTSYEESPLIAERIGDAEIVVMNKTPISKTTLEKCPNVKMIAVLATGFNVVDLAAARQRIHDYDVRRNGAVRKRIHLRQHPARAANARESRNAQGSLLSALWI